MRQETWEVIIIIGERGILYCVPVATCRRRRCRRHRCLRRRRRELSLRLSMQLQRNMQLHAL